MGGVRCLGLSHRKLFLVPSLMRKCSIWNCRRCYVKTTINLCIYHSFYFFIKNKWDRIYEIHIYTSYRHGYWNATDDCLLTERHIVLIKIHRLTKKYKKIAHGLLCWGNKDELKTHADRLYFTLLTEQGHFNVKW